MSPQEWESGEATDAELDQLLVDLRHLGHDHDPVPTGLIEFAQLAPKVARVQAEVARLIDAEEQMAGLRRDSDQMKSWVFDGGHLDIEISEDRLAGTVSASEAPSQVIVEWTDQSDQIVLDDFGGFTVDQRRGPCRIQVEFPGGSRVTTGWTLT
ncbi:MAG: hypothetical protein GY745_12560 [Actinomycetia bacterium]|nr:hypothetical protein [Actinomycetes bacterium]